MKLRGTYLVCSMEGHRLSAVWGNIQKDHVHIRGWHIADRPASIEEGNVEALGEWVGESLRGAGCRVKSCLIAVPRASVVLKRLTFPAMRQAAEGDLAGMVGLQMARQLTMPLQGAAIDFVRLAVPGEDSGAPTEVLAAALPGEQVAWSKSLSKAAKLSLKSVALRGEGSAALFAQLSYTQDGPILGVSVTPQGVELGVVSQGRVVFSRAVDVTPPTGVEEWKTFTERIALEAKRTRVGFRGAGENPDFGCVAVLGDDSLAASMGKALGSELELPWQTVRFPNAVDLPSDMDSSTRASVAPLIGLMLGAAIDRPTYDFANPRKVPDALASIRQAALAAVLGLILFGGGGWLWGDQDYRALDGQVATALQSAKSYQEKYVRQLRADARLQHIQKLRSDRVDWVGHLSYLTSSMPSADLARLDSIDGSTKAPVAFLHVSNDARSTEAKSLFDKDAQWVKNLRVEISVSGVAARDVADRLRAALVESAVYQVSTRGADVANRFDYQLVSAAPSPATTAPQAQGEGN
ncbi:MAG: hypothetical protein IPJ41_16055 [Phycisphaerales bacterium]|nr:hypothetical protein [Phycisphaerales bacterium]